MEKITYNTKESEEKWREFWEKEKIYSFNEKTKKPIFSVDTPPPYVSADHLHQGHIMSYSQAEFIVRYKRMRGFEVYYPMGFDDNGLPTERFVEKKYNLNKSKISRADFIKKCLEETKIGSKVYQDLWRLLGVSVDWSKTYSTIDQHSQKISQSSFLDLIKKGKCFRAKKPIMWCTTCQTALAQADLEDEEKETSLVYIKAKTDAGDSVIFATTRPELLPSCVG
ncbi:valine--tRNA ligase, partial [bacterium (Candidatus Gribaldobacteria) CG10_big_fil_rev_8_21_14_0_10_37_21]